MLEIKEAGLAGLAPFVGKGRSYGVWKERAPKSFWNRLDAADLIIGKGMANYETLDEYKKEVRGRAACIFLVKCETVGNSIRVKKGEPVAKVL